jgi:uncharacterized alkaline shock family protein YloU
MTDIAAGRSVDDAKIEKPHNRGRNTVTSRAVGRVVSAVTAEAFGVTAREVRADLADQDGLLAVHVRTPVRIVPLNRIRATPAVAESGGGTLLEQAAAAQEGIRDRVSELTGAGIARVVVELTGIDIREERRVR